MKPAKLRQPIEITKNIQGDFSPAKKGKIPERLGGFPFVFVPNVLMFAISIWPIEGQKRKFQLPSPPETFQNNFQKTNLRNFMLKHLKLFATAMFSFMLFTCSHAQESTIVDEQYIKENLGFTGFKILGVNATNYARCVSVYDYNNLSNHAKSVSIDNVEFKDDGTGYDLVAEDGILTSTSLYSYSSRSIAFVSIGSYRNLSNVLVADVNFKKTQEAIDKNNNDGNSKIKVEVECETHWVHCGGAGANCGACQHDWWPHGCIVLSNCHVSISLEW